MSSIKNLPVLGNVSLPVHIMGYHHKKDNKKFFQSGFAFFAVADDQADVEGPDGENIGSLGSCMGGHYQVHMHDEDESLHVIINVEDIWKQICELVESEDVKIKFEGIEKIYKEYWPKFQAAQEEKKAKKAKLKEIEDMQREAEEEAKKPVPEPIKVNDDVEILDDNGWNVKDVLPDRDWEAEEVDMKIPANFGCGVKARYEGETYTFKHEEKPVVTLKITSWTGMSIGAIHYYGKLEIGMPDMVSDETSHSLSGTPKWSIPMFSNNEIELTQILEQWEIDRYPENYKGWRAGDRHRGFYTQDGVERRAKEVFEKIFGEGWKLKIDKRF